MNGYDGSLMGAINAMQPYHDYFSVGMEGSGTGIVFCIYYVGNLVGSLFAGTVIDLLGRRAGMFSGSVFIIIGTIIEATAPSIGAFIGGRFLIGFGVALAVTAAPVYLVEMAYPSWRGITGGLYNVVGYYVGAISKFSIRLSLTRGSDRDTSCDVDHVRDWSHEHKLGLAAAGHLTGCAFINRCRFRLAATRESEMAGLPRKVCFGSRRPCKISRRWRPGFSGRCARAQANPGIARL